MGFKERKGKLKEMLAPRPKVVEGDKLVNYQGMDAYTESLMKEMNKKLDFWSDDLDTTHDTIVGAINEVNDKAKYIDGLATNKTIKSFPLSRATNGEVYKVPTTNRYVVCVKNYSGSLISLPNANFEELSVYENRKTIADRVVLGGFNEYATGTWHSVPFPKGLTPNNCVLIPRNVGADNYTYSNIKTNSVGTKFYAVGYPGNPRTVGIKFIYIKL